MLFERFRFYSLIHCFLFLLGAFSSFGQEKELVIQNKIDSIQRVIKIAKEDEGKVTALVELSRLYCDQKNFVEAKKIVNQSQALAKKKHFKKGIALSQISSGIILREEGKHKEALVQFESALRLTKDLKLKSEESLIYDQIAHAKFSVLDTLGSLNYHKKADDIRKELNDEIGTAYSSENIAVYVDLTDDCLTLEVEDNGIGLESDQLDKIFKSLLPSG